MISCILQPTLAGFGRIVAIGNHGEMTCTVLPFERVVILPEAVRRAHACNPGDTIQYRARYSRQGGYVAE